MSAPEYLSGQPNEGRAMNLNETVRRFILRFGESALSEANRRLHELELAGDRDGADTWRRVAAAIAARDARPMGGRLH